MTTPPRGTRAAVYLRISSDRDGEAAGVERQREDCRARATREGWTLAGEYVDNDTGASSKSRAVRRDYTRMVDDAKAGKVDVILAYSTSRLTRRPMEYEELIQLSERHGVAIRTIVSGDDDLSTADGQFVARIKAAQDAAESARISERVSRKALANARDGKWGGGRRPFGFEADGVTIRESEADEIRKATRTILNGGSLRSIVRDLNGRGIPTSTGKDWTSLTVKDMLRRPRNSGRIKYQPTGWDEDGRRKVNRSAESFATASWEPIVSEDERLAVVHILADPKRKQSPGNEHRWLGSSIYLCGVCGSPVRAETSGGRATRYTCRGNTTGGPNHLSRNAAKTDEVVNDEVLSLLHRVHDAITEAGYSIVSGAESGSTSSEWSRLTDELKANEQRQQDIRDDYADGVLNRTEFRDMLDRARQREAEIREQLTEPPSNTLARFANVASPGDIADMWQSLDISERRTLLRQIGTVTIQPTTARGPVFNPDDIRVNLALFSE